MLGLFLGMCKPNLKSVALTVLELYAFYKQKFWRSRGTGHEPFQKNFLRGHVTHVGDSISRQTA